MISITALVLSLKMPLLLPVRVTSPLMNTLPKLIISLLEPIRTSGSFLTLDAICQQAQKIFGLENVITLDTLEICLKCGAYPEEETEERLRQILATREAMSQSQRGNLIYTVKCLADELAYQERWAEAEPLYRKCFIEYDKKFGSEHQETIDSGHDLA